MKGENLIMALRAGYAFFYCQASPGETDKALSEMVAATEEFQNRQGVNPYSAKVWDYETTPDVEQALEDLDNDNPGTVLFAKNFHWFLTDDYGQMNKMIVQFLLNRANVWTTSEYRKALVIVGSEGMEALPSVLKGDFLPLEFELPGADEIAEQLEYILESAKAANPDFATPAEDERAAIVDAARGMGERDIRNAFAYTAISDGEINAATVSELKAQNLEGVAGLKIGKYAETFEGLKGYENLKDFTLGTIESEHSKGVILLGPPGTGKTTFCRALGNETGRIVLEMEMAELFGGRVGDSEKLMGAAIRAIKANGRCILFVDELEKALSGVGGRGAEDGGTTKRSMAQFLKFLSDERPPGLYVVATCNDITAIPPEWVRPGRWDSAPFFIDLPNDEEKDAIFDHYRKVFGVEGVVNDTAGWSGAEIESCCRIAKMFDISLDKAEKYIVPVSSTMREEIAGLRTWSEGRTLPATEAAPPPEAKERRQAIEM
jgi:AAA+ superfamily predicted ATPase